MALLAIDPSFSGFGMALADDQYKVLRCRSVSAGGAVFRGVAFMDAFYISCMRLYDAVVEFMEDIRLEDTDLIIELPVLATPSGAYLGMLHGFLAGTLFPKCRSVCVIPSPACDSFTKNKTHSKPFLVKWATDYYTPAPEVVTRKKGKKTIEVTKPKKLDHDCATAVVFVQLLKSIREGDYSNKYGSFSFADFEYDPAHTKHNSTH